MGARMLHSKQWEQPRERERTAWDEKCKKARGKQIVYCIEAFKVLSVITEKKLKLKKFQKTSLLINVDCTTYHNEG